MTPIDADSVLLGAEPQYSDVLLFCIEICRARCSGVSPLSPGDFHVASGAMGFTAAELRAEHPPERHQHVFGGAAVLEAGEDNRFMPGHKGAA